MKYFLSLAAVLLLFSSNKESVGSNTLVRNLEELNEAIQQAIRVKRIIAIGIVPWLVLGRLR